MTTLAKNQPNVECAYCQVRFYKSVSKQKNSKSGLFFCSRKHQGLAAKHESGINFTTGPTATKEKPLSQIVNCWQCQAPLTSIRSIKYFCTIDCQQDYKALLVEKSCIRCKVTKSVTEFAVRANYSDGYSNSCLKCERTYWQLWYNTDKSIKQATNAQANKKYADTKGEQLVLRKRLAKYNLTTEQYEEMLAKYDGQCHSCKQKKAIAVDHDHSSQEVRGLLCHSCNTGIGLLGDTIEGVEKALQYLQSKTPM